MTRQMAIRTESSWRVRAMSVIFSLGACTTGLLAAEPNAAADNPIDRAPSSGPDVTFHFQPEGKFFGDPIPFYNEGIHHVFYLRGWGWQHLASRDLVTWKQLPGTGITGATGNIVKKDDLFYLFYSGRIEKTRTVCLATSRDLVTWTNSEQNPLLRLDRDVPDDVYDTSSVWRDPHVFWNPEEKKWWMAVAAMERTDGAYGPAGAVACATSDDLMHWTVERKPMLLDRDSNAGECPDVFPFGDGWAMIYYPDASRIRLADSPRGPWRRPKNDAPSGLYFNAGKTEFDGKRHIWHGYMARLSKDYDSHVAQGVMALPRELYLDDVGNPAVRLVPEIVAACSKDATGGSGSKVFSPLLKSSVRAPADSVVMEAGPGDNVLALWKNAPADFFLSTDVTMAEGCQLTLHFRSNSKVDDSYILRIDALNSEVTFHHWKGWNRRSPMNARALEIPKNRSFKLHVMLNGDVFEAFLDDRIAMSSRVQLRKGSLALSARDGRAELKNLKITHLPQ